MSDIPDLNLYLVTFNCGRTLVKPEALASHFFDALPNTTPDSQLPDIIVLHLQEVAPLSEAFRGNSLAPYYNNFKNAVQLAAKQRLPNSSSSACELDGKSSYVDIIPGNVGLTSMILFVRADLQHHIVDVMSAGVGVGVQRMGNKGAVGLRIAWRTEDDIMNLTFVSAHLAPMEDAWERRNQDFVDIAAGLVFQPKILKPASSSTRSGSTGEDEPLLSTDPNDPSSTSDLVGMYAPDTHLFFSGDLNYRISDTPPAHDTSNKDYFPQPTRYLTFLPRDQLTQQRHAKNTLHGLTEAPITFPPTYKYSPHATDGKDLLLDSEVTTWQWSTHRWPSWCDRILFAQPETSTDTTKIHVQRYTALPLLATSDHRPVAMSVSIPLRPVTNPAFAAARPVELDPHWKANRDYARFKEVVVGTVWYSVSTADGAMNLTMGIAAVVCFAVLASVYARDW